MPKRTSRNYPHKRNESQSDSDSESTRPSKQKKTQNVSALQNGTIQDSSSVGRHASHVESYEDLMNFFENEKSKRIVDEKEKASTKENGNGIINEIVEINEVSGRENSYIQCFSDDGISYCPERRTRKGPFSLSKLKEAKNADKVEQKADGEFPRSMRVIPIPSKLMQVVSLTYPDSFTLHGYVKITVCLGSVSILGYNLSEGESAKVFSTEDTGWKKVSTLKSLHKSTVKQFKKKLDKLLVHEEKENPEDFLLSIGNKTVVVILEKALLPTSLQFLELYFPKALPTKNSSRKDFLHMCSSVKENVIDLNKYDEEIVNDIRKAIDKSVSENMPVGPRILVTGLKGTGKSTLLRFLVNSTLNMCSKVYYLDTDPGQTEFTPPAVVSLTEVTEPLLGPPFSHLTRPVKMIFTGSTTAATSPSMYLKSVQSLMKLFNAKYPREVLFVNTMGWLHGVGAMCLNSVKEAVKPSILVELITPGVFAEFSKEVLDTGETCIRMFTKAYSMPKFTAADWRNFSLLAYIGKCQKNYMPANFLNAVRPFCVCWDDIAIYVMGKKIPPYRLIEAMHCSVVALCYVQESYMLVSEMSEFPKTLYDEPLNECLGFGIVRASDEKNHLLYIITPLPLETLQKVNAIIKGNVILPDEVILNQPIHNVPLPFTDQSKETQMPLHKTAVKRPWSGSAKKAS